MNNAFNRSLSGWGLFLGVFAALIFLSTRPAISLDTQGVENIQSQGNETAIEVIEKLHGLLIRSMKMGDNTTCQERFKFLSSFIKNSFDFPTICRIVLGRGHWKKMDKETRKRFIEAFSDMTVATYARRFDSYSGERFRTQGARLDSRGHYIVDAVLIKANGDKIDFKYVCRKVGQDWKIVSVSARGVNDLSVKRADYNAFLKKHTITELIEKLHEQADRCLGKRDRRQGEK